MKDPYELRVIADALDKWAEGPGKDAMNYASSVLREIALEVEADVARMLEPKINPIPPLELSKLSGSVVSDTPSNLNLEQSSLTALSNEAPPQAVPGADPTGAIAQVDMTAPAIGAQNAVVTAADPTNIAEAPNGAAPVAQPASTTLLAPEDTSAVGAGSALTAP